MRNHQSENYINLWEWWENQKRVDTFRKRYKSCDPFSDHPKFYYGSHYSSPAIVFHYMIRLRPYNKGA